MIHLPGIYNHEINRFILRDFIIYKEYEIK